MTGQGDSSDEVPPRHRHDSDADESPPRRRHDSDGDESPPRRHHDSDGDESPPRRRQDSDREDASPPRKSSENLGKVSEKIHESSSDRRKVNVDRSRVSSNSNAEQPRMINALSASYGFGGYGGNEDRKVDPDINDSQWDINTNKVGSSGKLLKRRKKTASGHDAGLQSGTAFGRTESKMKANRDEEMRGTDPSLQGEGADTVYRDRKGKKLDMLNEFMRQQAVKDGKEFKIEKAQTEWGKGTVQKQEAEALRQELVDVANEPFARTIDNPRMEAMRKGTMRDGDPMAEYFAKKKEEEDEIERARRASIRRGDEVLVVVEKPKYKGPIGAPNRFRIPPGYRWDGIDRGNRYEHKILTKSNDRAALKEDEYRWSVSDM